MKKLYITLLTIFGCGMLSALPLGNPAEASLLSQGWCWHNNDAFSCRTKIIDNLSLRVGFYGDYVFQRHLEIDNTNNHSAIEESTLYTNAGYLALNFYNRCDIFATLGSSHLYFETGLNTFDPLRTDTTRLQFDTFQHFSWSLGARATLLQCKCTALGIEGQYFSTKSNEVKVSNNYFQNVYPDLFNMKYEEWQVGFGITQRISLFAPYIGIKWSKVNSTQSIVSFPGSVGLVIPPSTLTNRNHVACAIGISFIDCRGVLLNVEGRYGDEKALYANGQIRF